MYGFMQKMKEAQEQKPANTYFKDMPQLPHAPSLPHAFIVVEEGDWEHAKWEGGEDMVAPITFWLLEHVERLPWKLLEVCEDRERQIRWFRRA